MTPPSHRQLVPQSLAASTTYRVSNTNHIESNEEDLLPRWTQLESLQTQAGSLAKEPTQMYSKDGAAFTETALESRSRADLEEEVMTARKSLKDQGYEIQSLKDKVTEMAKQLAENEQHKDPALYRDSRSKMEVKINKKVNVTLSDDELRMLATAIIPGSEMHLKLQEITNSRANVTILREVQSFFFGKLINYDSIDMLVLLREIAALVPEQKSDLPSIITDPLATACDVDDNVKTHIKTQDTQFDAEITKAVGGSIPNKRKRLGASPAEAHRVFRKQGLTAQEPLRSSKWFQTQEAPDDETYLGHKVYEYNDADPSDASTLKE